MRPRNPTWSRRRHFTSVKACKELLGRVAVDAPVRGRIVLAVTNYDNDIRLTDAQMATTLGISHSVPDPGMRGPHWPTR